jgi:Protein of unknown function (DUF3995)
VRAPRYIIAARLACVIGVLYALVSIYWGLGGTWLIGTVGGSLARAGRARSAGVIAAVWAAAVLKLAAAALPLLALTQAHGDTRRVRRMRALSWLAGVILTAYGLVLTSVGLLVQAGVIHESAHADHRALAWHAFLWDPWFLVWGILIVAAMRWSHSALDSRA